MVDLKEFEKFSGLIKAKARFDQISIRKSGQIIFGKGATINYGTEKFEFAFLYFNKKTQEIALKLLESDEPGSIAIKKSRGATTIWAKPFFKHYNLELKSSIRITPEFFEKEQVFIWKMPKE